MWLKEKGGCEVHGEVKFIETESVVVVTRGWGERESEAVA